MVYLLEGVLEEVFLLPRTLRSQSLAIIRVVDVL